MEVTEEVLEIRKILDSWEEGKTTHWVAMSSIRKIVGGERDKSHR